MAVGSKVDSFARQYAHAIASEVADPDCNLYMIDGVWQQNAIDGNVVADIINCNDYRLQEQYKISFGGDESTCHVISEWEAAAQVNGLIRLRPRAMTIPTTGSIRGCNSTLGGVPQHPVCMTTFYVQPLFPSKSAERSVRFQIALAINGSNANKSIFGLGFGAGGGHVYGSGSNYYQSCRPTAFLGLDMGRRMTFLSYNATGEYETDYEWERVMEQCNLYSHGIMDSDYEMIASPQLDLFDLTAVNLYDWIIQVSRDSGVTALNYSFSVNGVVQYQSAEKLKSENIPVSDVRPFFCCSDGSYSGITQNVTEYVAGFNDPNTVDTGDRTNDFYFDISSMHLG